MNSEFMNIQFQTILGNFKSSIGILIGKNKNRYYKNHDHVSCQKPRARKLSKSLCVFDLWAPTRFKMVEQCKLKCNQNHDFDWTNFLWNYNKEIYAFANKHFDFPTYWFVYQRRTHVESPRRTRTEVRLKFPIQQWEESTKPNISPLTLYSLPQRLKGRFTTHVLRR